nr:MAG TPA: hypothetical protein [Caudoviricetes sp.]
MINLRSGKDGRRFIYRLSKTIFYGQKEKPRSY